MSPSTLLVQKQAALSYKRVSSFPFPRLFSFCPKLGQNINEQIFSRIHHPSNNVVFMGARGEVSAWGRVVWFFLDSKCPWGVLGQQLIQAYSFYCPYQGDMPITTKARISVFLLDLEHDLGLDSGVLLGRQQHLDVLVVVLEILELLLLELLELLVDLVLLLDHFDDFGHLGPVQDLVHGGVSGVAQEQGERIEDDDVDVVVAQQFGLEEGLLELLLDEDVDLVQVLQEGLVQVLLDVADVVEQRLQEPVEADEAGEDAADPEVFAGDVEEVGVEVFDLDDGVDLVEGDLDDLLVRQLLLHVEEVVEQLADVPHRVRQRPHPLLHLAALPRLLHSCVHEHLRRLYHVLLVLRLVDYVERHVVVLDVPVPLPLHFNYILQTQQNNPKRKLNSQHFREKQARER